MKKSIKDTVREAIAPTVSELGYRIWDITYSKIGADYHLEITIDNDEGINIDDCERVHRAIDPILDEIDPIETFYYLDVSSPGIERELKCDMHIEACEGWDVEVKLYAPLNGSKLFHGKPYSKYDKNNNPAGTWRFWPHLLIQQNTGTKPVDFEKEIQYSTGADRIFCEFDIRLVHYSENYTKKTYPDGQVFDNGHMLQKSIRHWNRRCAWHRGR